MLISFFIANKIFSIESRRQSKAIQGAPEQAMGAQTAFQSEPKGAKVNQKEAKGSPNGATVFLEIYLLGTNLQLKNG